MRGVAWMALLGWAAVTFLHVAAEDAAHHQVSRVESWRVRLSSPPQEWLCALKQNYGWADLCSLSCLGCPAPHSSPGCAAPLTSHSLEIPFAFPAEVLASSASYLNSIDQLLNAILDVGDVLLSCQDSAAMESVILCEKPTFLSSISKPSLVKISYISWKDAANLGSVLPLPLVSCSQGRIQTQEEATKNGAAEVFGTLHCAVHWVQLWSPLVSMAGCRKGMGRKMKFCFWITMSRK